MFMETIYIDRLFALNFIVDYLILIVTARICGIFMRRKRYGFSAAFGAAYAVFSVLPDTAFLSAFPVKILAGVLMSLIAFRGETKLMRCTFVFFAVSALFGGAIWAVSMQSDGRLHVPLSFGTLILSFIVIYALMSLVFRRSVKGRDNRISRMRITHFGKSVEVSALRDSGNTLFDPISGAGAVIISPTTAGEFFGAADWSKPTEAVTHNTGMRLIPYNAVGVESGLLAAFRPDELRLDDKPRDDLIVAVSPVEIGGDAYNAIAQEEHS